MPTTPEFDEAALDQFFGTENYYRHGLVKGIVYTDGVKYLADNAGAHWLVDEIALANGFEAKVKAEEFQAWKLTVADGAAKLTCDDGNGNIVYYKDIDYTDFPLPTITLYVEGKVILLPSEH